VRQFYVLHSQLAQDRERVSIERVFPLLPMLGVAPCYFLVGKKLSDSVCKRQALALSSSQRVLLIFTHLYGVNTLSNLLACLTGRLAGHSERYARVTTKSDIAHDTPDPCSQYPRTCIASDLQCQTRHYTDKVQPVTRQS
jgi:hypothetical protein